MNELNTIAQVLEEKTQADARSANALCEALELVARRIAQTENSGMNSRCIDVLEDISITLRQQAEQTKAFQEEMLSVMRVMSQTKQEKTESKPMVVHTALDLEPLFL
jgi:hypothetical protein